MEAVSQPRTERGNRQLSLECGSVNGACLSLRAFIERVEEADDDGGFGNQGWCIGAYALRVVGWCMGMKLWEYV